MYEKRIKAAHRFFFALFPPLELARQIQQAMAPFAEDARMMRPERLHVTLDILDDFAVYPEEIVQALVAAGSRVAAAPFEVTLDRLSGGAHTIALRPGVRNAGLSRLHDAIATARGEMGVAARGGSRFSPHMTLVYREGAPVTRRVAPYGWMAEEFVLIHSLIGQTRHDVIGRWPLTAVPAPIDDGQLMLL